MVLAVLGAACYAIAAVNQRRAAAQLPESTSFDPGILLRLARARRWQVSLVAMIAGFGLQAAALELGRLVMVEPVLPFGLLFALLLAARADGRRMHRMEWTAAVAAIGGLAVFLVAGMPSGGQRAAGAGPLGVVAAGAVVVAGLCWLLAPRIGAHRALVLSIGGGICAGVTDALTKTAAYLAVGHHLGVLVDVRLYLLAVVGLTTFTMQQNGFRAGGIPASLPAFAVLEPIVGSVLGIVIYDEDVAVQPVRIVIEAAAVLAAVWGIIRLAQSVQVVSAPRPEPVKEPADPVG